MKEKPLILIADDEEDVRDLVGENLRRAGFDTGEAADGLAALRYAREQKPDAIVLDVMMPGCDGLHVCRELRNDDDFCLTPIIMLTAKNAAKDCIAGLETGADDYITKPFSPKELVLRVQAVLRRTDATKNGKQLVIGPFHFDIPGVRLTVDGKLLDLTVLEFKLLHLLAAHHRSMTDRSTIFREVWGFIPDVHSRTLDTHVKRLREKLGSYADWIQTGRRAGYVFQQPKTDMAMVADQGLMHENRL